MFSTAIIIFRETIEIAMILSVIFAATRGLAGRMLWIAGGLAAGLACAGLVAAFAETISDSLSGLGQEFFNALILFAAAIVIGSTVVWMRTHAGA
jgi:high-affinity iron transporter